MTIKDLIKLTGGEIQDFESYLTEKGIVSAILSDLKARLKGEGK